MFIRNVILDMGGVIIDIDFKRTAEAFARLGVPNFYEIYNQRGQDNFIDEFETGKISAAQFRQELRKKFKLAANIKDSQIDEAWNALFIELPPERLELIKGLRKQFSKLFLFSNTNAIHYEKFASMCPDSKAKGKLDPRVPVFTGCFDEEHYSFRLGQKKPKPEAFTAILKRHGLKAGETVFIDDSIQHVKGAIEAGLHAIHLDLTKGMSLMMVPQLLAALNKTLQERSEMKEAEARALSFDSDIEEISPSPPQSLMEDGLGRHLLPASAKNNKTKSSWFSCCFPFFGKGNKKAKSEEKAEVYQYLPSVKVSV